MIGKILRFALRVYRNTLFNLKKPGYYLRQNKFHKGAFVSSNVQLRKCIIGPYTSIGSNCVLNKAKIGSYCSLASCVMIGGEEHAYWDISTSNHLSKEGITETETIIGNDVWIGAQCYLRQGVIIGNGVVIGANSFVNKDIPDFAIVVGSPAKIIKYRFDEELRMQISKSRYWDFKPDKARNIIHRIMESNNI